MKIVALGDTHGRLNWKDIILKEDDADKIIFIGDYFDTRTGGVSGNKQLENFKDIIAYKKANPDKVILLFGNHDFHYLRGIGETYSGYQAGYAHDISELIHDALNQDLLQMCYQHDKYFFSHAGLTKTWAEARLGTPLPQGKELVNTINDLFKFKPNNFKFSVGDNFDQSGDDVTQSPIWVRPNSLVKDMVDNVVCIVGHTQVRQLGLNPQLPKLILIDCLGFTLEYLVIENGAPRVAHL